MRYAVVASSIVTLLTVNLTFAQAPITEEEGETKPLKSYVAPVKSQLAAIEKELKESIKAAGADTDKIIALIAKRDASREKVFEGFLNERTAEYRKLRQIKSLRLSCRAGRGRLGRGVPKDAQLGKINIDDGYEYVTHEVSIQNDISGSHTVTMNDDKTEWHFTVRCTGVDYTDTGRGHGAYEATLRVQFKCDTAELDRRAHEDLTWLRRQL